MLNRSEVNRARGPREPTGPELHDRNRDAGMVRRSPLDDRKHPPAQRSRSPGTGTRERGPLDALGSAIGSISRDRAMWVESPDGEEPGDERLRGGDHDRVGVPAAGKPLPQPAGPAVPGRRPSWPASPDRDRGSYREQNHLIPQRRPLKPIFIRKCSRGDRVRQPVLPPQSSPYGPRMGQVRCDPGRCM
jgi:hypothetical protein